MNKEILMFDKKELEYGLEYMEVEQSKETFFHLVVKIEEDEENDVMVLESFDELIKKINAKCGAQFSINTLWNDVSMYYGKKLYPVISNVENTLRKIIYLFMQKTVGNKWLDISTPAKFRENIDEIIERNQKEKSEAGIDWLMYFSDKLSVNSGKEFSKKWSALYNYRNAVAHGKIIYRTDYNNAVKFAEMFAKMFEECISVIDTLQINNEQAEVVEAVAQQVISKSSENVLARSSVRNNGIGINDYNRI